MNETRRLIQSINSKGNLSCYETERLARWYQEVDESNALTIKLEINKIYGTKEEKGYCIIL